MQAHAWKTQYRTRKESKEYNIILVQRHLTQLILLAHAYINKKHYVYVYV